MNPEYRIRRRRKHLPGDPAHKPTGPLRWRLEQRVPSTGIVSIFREWEWKTIRYRTTHAGAIAAMNARVRRPAALEAGRGLDMPARRALCLCERCTRADLGQPAAPPATWDNRAHARP